MNKTTPGWNRSYISAIMSHHKIETTTQLATLLDVPYKTLWDQLQKPKPSSVDIVFAFKERVGADLNKLLITQLVRS